jgi:hypothetical protein
VISIESALTERRYQTRVKIFDAVLTRVIRVYSSLRHLRRLRATFVLLVDSW